MTEIKCFPSWPSSAARTGRRAFLADFRGEPADSFSLCLLMRTRRGVSLVQAKLPNLLADPPLQRPMAKPPSLSLRATPAFHGRSATVAPKQETRHLAKVSHGQANSPTGKIRSAVLSAAPTTPPAHPPALCLSVCRPQSQSPCTRPSRLAGPWY